jgi:DNA-binding NtrC family response regulator
MTDQEQGIRVLLIDDEADYIQSLSKVLRRRGLVVLTANGGEEGLRTLAREPVDVAVLDLKMPGLGGLEVLQQIKAEHPEVEVILLTGHATVESGVEGMKMGAADYLFKPQDPDALLQNIQYAAGLRAKSEGKGGWWPFGKK